MLAHALAAILMTQTQPAVTNMEFLEQYAATYRFQLGQPKGFVVTPNCDAVLFLRSTGPRTQVQDLWQIDPETGQESVVLTADQLLGGGEEKLTAEELARRERMRMSSRGIVSFQLSEDGTKILAPLSGRLFVYDRAKKAATELKGGDGFAIDPTFSPDGTKIACVRNGEIYVTPIGGEERKVTSGAGGTITNGLAEFVAQEEMGRFRGYWWSPDSTRIAYQQTDTAGMETFSIADPSNPAAPVQSWPYPRAGGKNAAVRLGLINAAGGDTTWVAWDGKRNPVSWDGKYYPYLASVTWQKNAPLTILIQNREQTEQFLFAVGDDGSLSELLIERDDAWINLAPNNPTWLPNGNGFLWLTEQHQGADGWIFELRRRDGTLERRLVGPENGAGPLVAFDKDTLSFVYAGGTHPTFTDLFRVSLLEPPAANTIPPATLIRMPGGQNAGAFGKSHKLWVHTSSGAGGQVAWRLVKDNGMPAVDHPSIDIRSIAEEPPFTPRVELTTIAKQGNQFHAAVIRPRDFDPAKKYPVIEHVYGGPHAQTVSAASRGYLLQQWLADQGFIVVSVDTRGTPRRGRAWERAIKNDVMTIPLEEHAAALRELGAKFPEMDMTRVGITGWSFGGYFSAMAAMRMPELYKAAVVGAPVADWRDYDTHYTERYMGLPADNAAGYDKASVLTYCKDLTVPLLIIHGTADDNVYFMHSLKMTEALFRAGKDFEFLPLAGFTHMVPEPEVTKRLQSRVAGFFLRNLAGPSRIQP